MIQHDSHLKQTKKLEATMAQKNSMAYLKCLWLVAILRTRSPRVSMTRRGRAVSAPGLALHPCCSLPLLRSLLSPPVSYLPHTAPVAKMLSAACAVLPAQVHLLTLHCVD